MRVCVITYLDFSMYLQKENMMETYGIVMISDFKRRASFGSWAEKSSVAFFLYSRISPAAVCFVACIIAFQQPVFLKHSGDFFAGKPVYKTGIRLFQPEEDFEKRCLSGPGRRHETIGGAGGEREVQAGKHSLTVKAFAQVRNNDIGRVFHKAGFPFPAARVRSRSRIFSKRTDNRMTVSVHENKEAVSRYI